MPRSRARPKKHAKATRVKAKPKNLRVPAATYFSTTQTALSYDSEKTQFENYGELGLLADSNQIGAVRGSIRGFHPRVKGPCAETAADPDAPHPLELEVPEAAITIRIVPEGECKVLRTLLARHGDDYAAMARDMRINTHQHTAAHLRRRVSKMREQDAEDEATADAAAKAAAPAPEPRFRRKATRDPNPAFKKRSKQFI